MGDLADALERVDEHANDEWRELAKRVVGVVARNFDRFTADQVWALLGTFPDVRTHEPRALGPIMMWAVREQIIEPIVSRDRPCPTCGTEKAVRASMRNQRQQGDVTIYRRKI